MTLIVVELRISRLCRVDRVRKGTRSGRPVNIAVLDRHKFDILLTLGHSDLAGDGEWRTNGRICVSTHYALIANKDIPRQRFPDSLHGCDAVSGRVKMWTACKYARALFD